MFSQLTWICSIFIMITDGFPHQPDYTGQKQEKIDEPPPQYQYKYEIQNGKGGGQGKVEMRGGFISFGRYYVQGHNSSQNVEYVVNDSGYHPYFEYANVGPHSRTSAHFASDTEALKALKKKNLDRPEDVNAVVDSQVKSGEQQPRYQHSYKTTHSWPSNPTRPLHGEQPNLQITQNLERPEDLNFVVDSQVKSGEQQPRYQHSYEITHSWPNPASPLHGEQPNVQITQGHSHESQNKTQEQPQNDPGTKSPMQEHTDLGNPHLINAPTQENIIYSDQEYKTYKHLDTIERNPQIYLNYQGQESFDNVNEHRMIFIPIHDFVSHGQNPMEQQFQQQYDDQLQQQTKISTQEKFPRASQLILRHFSGAQDQNSLFSNTGNNEKIKDALQYENEENLINVSEHLGGYGSKIKPPTRKTHKKLVTGQDVLDINQAVDESKLDGIKFDEIPTITTALISEYAPSAANALERNVVTDQNNLGSTTVKSISLFNEPIVVPDENEGEEQHNVEIAITQKPVSTTPMVPQRADETAEIKPTENVVVDFQASIPYYLGNIAYYEPGVGENNITTSANNNLVLGEVLRGLGSKSEQIQEQVEDDAANLVEKPLALASSFDYSIKDNVKDESNPVPATNFNSLSVPSSIGAKTFAHSPLSNQGEASAFIANSMQVTKYIDRPYPVPVEVPKPYPVEVERVVEKIVQQPYPVEVKVPVPVETKVPFPQYIEKTVTVPQYIPKPYPVAVNVPVPIPQTFYIPIEVAKPYPVHVTQFIDKPYPVRQLYPVHVPVEVRVPKSPHYPKNKQRLYPQHVAQGSSFSATKIPCVDMRILGIQKPFCGLNNNNYIGLVPPKFSNIYQNATNLGAKQRKARQNFESNIRFEYGFLPPLIPSLQIDENGNPVDKL